MKFSLLPKEVRGRNISYRPELDGIRAISIVIVIMHHIGYLHGRGFLGVDVFFTLSGFLITQILMKYFDEGTKIRKFYRRRLARLYPILLIGVASSVWFFDKKGLTQDIKPAIASVLYVKNFYHWGDLTGPFWSLSAEEQFYLFFPILLILFHKYLSRRIFTGFLIFAIAAIWAGVLYINYPIYVWNKDGIYNLVVFRPSMILLGCLVALNKEFLIRLTVRARWVFMAIFLASLYLCITIQFPGFAAIGTASAILLLSEEVAQKSVAMRFFRAVLGFKPLAWIGVLSYSIYIWHMPIILFLTSNWSHGLPSLWLFAAWVLGAAIASFYLIEAPLQRLLSGSVRKN